MGRSLSKINNSADRKARKRAARYGVSITPVNRRRVIERDKQTCYMCGRKIARHELALDHVVPLSRGGPHSESNLRVACKPCNLRKGDKLPCECEWLRPSDGTLVIKR